MGSVLHWNRFRLRVARDSWAIPEHRLDVCLDLCGRQKNRGNRVVYLVAKIGTRRFQFLGRDVGDDFQLDRFLRGRKIQASRVSLGVSCDALLHVTDLFTIRTVLGIAYASY